MATASNKDVLAAAGLLADDAAAPAPNDLVVAIDAAEDAADDALAAAEEALSARAAPPRRGRRRAAAPAHAGRGVGRAPHLAMISTPGRYAAAEALKALRLGLNAFVFSDNVPLEQEVELKRDGARARPDRHGARTAGRRSSAACRSASPTRSARGDIGLIGASGTGLQQVSSLIDRLGRGREPGDRRRQPRPRAPRSAPISMLDAIDALAADPATRVLGLVSKPPDPEVAERVLARAAASGKPVVAAFLGGRPGRRARRRRRWPRRSRTRRGCSCARRRARTRRRATPRPRATPPRRAASAACSAGCTPAGRSPTRPTCCSRRDRADHRGRRPADGRPPGAAPATRT